jgi:hypothetical protein
LVDRGLALDAAFEEEAPNLDLLNCQKHIDGNLIKNNFASVVSLWHIANQAVTESKKKWAMDKIRAINPRAAVYIESIPHAFLLDKAQKGKKVYGMLTSNLIEQLNAEFLPERAISGLAMLVRSYITKSVEKQEREKVEANACRSIICPAALEKVSTRNNESIGGEFVARLVCKETKTFNIVPKRFSTAIVPEHFETYCALTNVCSCMRSEQDELPCSCAALVLRVLNTEGKGQEISLTELYESGKFFGQGYMTDSWKEVFTDYVVNIPTPDQVESFLISHSQDMNFPSIHSSFKLTTERVSRKRITSTGEKKSGSTVSSAYAKGDSKKKQCNVCGRTISVNTLHNTSACEKFARANPAFNANAHKRDRDAQSRDDDQISINLIDK